MPGRSDLIRIAIIALMGAALAAPIGVLELTDGARGMTVPLGGPTFTYTYRQSIYQVPVREELRVIDGGIRIDRAASPDIRALEYFRWPGSAVPDDGGLAWTAPDNATDHLQLLLTAEGEQAIDTGLRRVTLRDAFGTDASVRVRPGRAPLLVWLWSLRG
ncbi:MAG: hypothetical protein HYX56_03935 [Chloroflexi bacterium]|nr:hypothetical protein [Chloroflexota bacterium]